MTEESDSSQEYIDADEITISLESELADVFVTEDDLEYSPVISAEADSREGVVAVHLPLLLNWADNDDLDDIAFAESLVHTQLDLEDAREFLDQFEAAVEELEEE